MKINEVTAPQNQRTAAPAPGQPKSFMASVLQGMGATQAATAVQAYSNAKVRSGGSVTSTDTQTQPAPATAATAASAPMVDAATAFKNPQIFKAEWDKYVANKGGDKYHLISDPAMLQVLKNIWMRMGGTKVESRNHKGTQV